MQVGVYQPGVQIFFGLFDGCIRLRCHRVWALVPLMRQGQTAGDVGWRQRHGRSLNTFHRDDFKRPACSLNRTPRPAAVRQPPLSGSAGLACRFCLSAAAYRGGGAGRMHRPRQTTDVFLMLQPALVRAACRPTACPQRMGARQQHPAAPGLAAQAPGGRAGHHINPVESIHLGDDKRGDVCEAVRKTQPCPLFRSRPTAQSSEA